MSGYNYTEHVNSNLICCICRMPFIEPTVTKTCSHTFCKECIRQALSVAPQCPVDRSPLRKEELEPANPIIRHLVDELIVECPRRPLGCTHTCQRQLLASHLREDCAFVTVQCNMEECNETILRKDGGKHSESCQYRLLECPACRVAVRFKDLKSHQDECPEEETLCNDCDLVLPRNELWSHLSECLNKIVNCQYAEYGCSWSGYRHELVSTHSPQCVYEALKGFLSLNSSRLASLEMENAMLRERLKGLEYSLRSTRQDLQIAKAVLGPWFRSEDAPPRPSPPMEPPPRSYPRPQSSNSLNTLSHGPSDAGPSGESNAQHLRAIPDITNDPLAQYFPPETPSATSDDPLSPGFDSSYPRIAQGSPVAPLNLNTTLEGSLASLRNSIVTLAATLDSEVRRHDLALNTETLRVNEDIMALRAIVYGLRMQVHQIMMDRNSQVTQGDDDDGTGVKFSHIRANTLTEPWTVPGPRYLNHYPPGPLPRPLNLGPAHIQATKL